MGHQQDVATACGRPKPDGTGMCPGTKSTVYVYDDHGNCVSQMTYPCGVCGQQ